jgi:hypothetical protein
MRTVSHLRRYTVLLAVLLSSLTGCGILGFDHSSRVAKGLLFQQKGRVDNTVVTATLNARFPPGSNFADLTTFARSLGGGCVAATSERGWCDIPITGVICAEYGIAVSVTTLPDGSIQHIEAQGAGKYC